MLRKRCWLYSKIKVRTSDYCALTQDVSLSFFQLLFFFIIFKTEEIWCVICFCARLSLVTQHFNKRLDVPEPSPPLGASTLADRLQQDQIICLHPLIVASIMFIGKPFHKGLPKSQQACLKRPVPPRFQLLQTVQLTLWMKEKLHGHISICCFPVLFFK